MKSIDISTSIMRGDKKILVELTFYLAGKGHVEIRTTPKVGLTVEEHAYLLE